MDLEIVFNEISLKTPASDIATARQWMSNLIDTIRAVKPASGVKRKLRAKSDFQYLLLAEDYRVIQWRNDPDVDLETRRFLKALQDKNDPPLPDIAAPEIEVIYQGKQAIGLQYAFVFNALVVSLMSEPEWNCSRLELEVTSVDDNDELITKTESVIHASSIEHVREHNEWIRNRLTLEVLNGTDLWNRRNELFPSLEFCEDVAKQIECLYSGNPMLGQVVERLYHLDNYCKTWTDGAFDLNRLPYKISPESDSRLKQLKQNLTFQCPDGEERIFSLHARMTPGAWRLHFCVELGPGKIIIGYIGLKIQ
ncbi:hypothetical protein [Microseira sp. BLCC-F43]|jgi:hypothetical protein|uniref:hypothetical protein n=1 Tax=Microseira sp. BLCC-F43 TaxID=3153602 RepID=UPI0035B6F9A4